MNMKQYKLKFQTKTAFLADKQFDGVTFKTMTLIKKYMTKKGLQFEFIEP